MKYSAVIVAGVGLFGLLVWFQYSLWSECRQTNSWFYCARVLNK